jgi:hypothetical protein
LGEGQHLLPAWASLAVIVGVLAIAIGASLFAKWREDRLGITPAGDAHPAPGHPPHSPEGPNGMAATPDAAAEEAKPNAH